MGVPHLPVWPISQAGTAVLVFDMGVWQITLSQVLALGLSEAVQKCFPMSSWYSPSSASPVHPRVLQRKLAHPLLTSMWEGEVSDGHSAVTLSTL